METGWIVVIVAAVVLLLVAVAYNRFVRTRQLLRESWSGIDVEMRRRYDLIPNLVETVRGYARHEQEVLDRVVQARAAAAANEGDHDGQIRDEQRLVGELRQLFAVAEGYPDLKADRGFRDLQAQLAETEDRIAAIRRLHNANVRRWNTLGETVPWRLLRGLVNWEREPYFEVEDAVRATVPGFGTETA